MARTRVPCIMRVYIRIKIELDRKTFQKCSDHENNKGDPKQKFNKIREGLENFRDYFERFVSGRRIRWMFKFSSVVGELILVCVVLAHVGVKSTFCSHKTSVYSKSSKNEVTCLSHFKVWAHSFCSTFLEWSTFDQWSFPFLLRFGTRQKNSPDLRPPRHSWINTHENTLI